MTPDHEALADWDAAYVLGALSPADRRVFESHLEECERCRTAVADLAAMPGLLSRARPMVEALDEPEPAGGPPADLVHRVTARRRRRSIRTRVIVGVSALAAAIVLLFAVPALIPDTAAPTTVALTPVEATTMSATVELSSAPWGTRLHMDCDYPAGGYGTEPGDAWRYVLVVTDAQGRASDISTWNAVPGKTVHLDAATDLNLDEIATIEVRSTAGDTILTGSTDGP
ncbi:Putative zinc-finger [Paramicrobacterium humi]|uniref:Putative zinc-finger n=1 Tax=Paramicrobacterium humi TaxID=640635 RepID=A0A1H4KRH5_9MICO|nr:zf-HC2 domain-containing protein [Microbacterium humi]SEB61149.1 Putative zinc-finger [Microbacterium humi]